MDVKLVESVQTVGRKDLWATELLSWSSAERSMESRSVGTMQGKESWGHGYHRGGGGRGGAPERQKDGCCSLAEVKERRAPGQGVLIVTKGAERLKKTGNKDHVGLQPKAHRCGSLILICILVDGNFFLHLDFTWIAFVTATTVITKDPKEAKPRPVKA